MRTLPIGTLEMSVTAQTSPDAVADDSGVQDVALVVVAAVAIGVVVDGCCGSGGGGVAACCRNEAMPRLELTCAVGWLYSGVCLSLP